MEERIDFDIHTPSISFDPRLYDLAVDPGTYTEARFMRPNDSNLALRLLKKMFSLKSSPSMTMRLLSMSERMSAHMESSMCWRGSTLILFSCRILWCVAHTVVYRPLKDEPYRTRMVVGGDKLTYFEDPGSPAAPLVETKLFLNSVISDAHLGARFLSCDLKDFSCAHSWLAPNTCASHCAEYQLTSSNSTISWNWFTKILYTSKSSAVCMVSNKQQSLLLTNSKPT